MGANSEYEEIYNLANCLEKQQKYDEAIHLFNLLLGTNYHDSSCILLSKIYLEVDNYQKAREILSNLPNNIPAYLAQKSYLEELEMNFQKALTYFDKLSQFENDLEKTLYEAVHIKKSLGELETAKNLIELLLDSPKYREKVIHELVGITLVDKNMDLLTSLPVEHQEFLKRQKMDRFFQAVLNPNNSAIRKPLEKIYMFERYFSENNESLYRHLEKHIEGNVRDCYFLKYINIPFLVEEATEKMQAINPLFFGFSYQYIIQMEGTVGIVNKQPTKDLIACTFAGNSNIITMYPVLLSNQFNQEGYLTDKTLLLKRKEMLK